MPYFGKKFAQLNFLAKFQTKTIFDSIHKNPAKSKAVETPPSHECNYLIILVITQPSRPTGAHFSTGRKKWLK